MELNRERIIRGLECCKGSYDCFTCDIYKRGCAGWRDGLARDALSLIKKLTEENERLENALIEQSAENVMLCGEVKHARADTVRKMQERLKDKTITIIDMVTDDEVYAVKLSVIDQIVKEMIGEANGN